MNIISLISVFIGSGLGGVCRWVLSIYFNWQFPLGTLIANILGCFVLGFLTRLSPGNEHIRLLFMTGFCGGFTTFSTFMNESLMLMRGNQLTLSLLYIGISLVFGLAAAWLGYQISLR